MSNNRDSGTRTKRSSGHELPSQIKDTINIANNRLHQLLSPVGTKQDLTIYLVNHTATALDEINKPYVVTFDTISETNINQFTIDMTQHDHEEADTLLILHCWDIALLLMFFCYCYITFNLLYNA